MNSDQYAQFQMIDGEFEFDEYAYLYRNADVRNSVLEGQFVSGRQHFEIYGKSEKRPTCAAMEPGPRVFIAGAYGTRNVGDEAIFDGARCLYRNAIQLYINAPRELPAVEMYSMLRGVNKFRSIDTLIIGGGGLLYDARSIGVLADLAARAREAGAAVRIERIGCEAARPEYHSVIADLLHRADSVSVRSTISQQILRDICGLDATLEEDFALELKSKLPGRRARKGEVLRIGVVTGGDHMEDIGPLVQLIRDFSSDRSSLPVRFIHIPHSASFIGFRNNDEIVGAKISAEIGVFLEGRRHGFTRIPYKEEPIDVLKEYAGLDALITRRFHGLVFAHMMNIPVLGLPGDGLKNRSFILDHPRSNLVEIEQLSKIRDGFAELIDKTKRRMPSDA